MFIVFDAAKVNGFDLCSEANFDKKIFLFIVSKEWKIGIG